MSGNSNDMVTILSSDEENERNIQAESNKTNANDRIEASTSKRRVPLQRIVTGKEIFSEFLEKCRTNDKSTDMEKIVNKLWKRFNEASESYTKSSTFKELVHKVIIEADSKPYSALMTVRDELNNNKKTNVEKLMKNSLPSCSASTSKDNNDEGLDPKTLLHMKKLDKLLIKLHSRIQRLENAELDLNSSDEENSAYLQVARYKERFCQVYQKLCELKKKDPHAERPLWKYIKFSATQIPEVDKAIEKFYNDQREFPDYRDILTVVKKANEVKMLNLSSAEISGIARKAFGELGKLLKKYRQWDDIEVIRSYCPDDKDPAAQDMELENALEENSKKYARRIDDVIDKYAVMQDEERLEPPEVNSDDNDEEDTEEEEQESDCGSQSSILEVKSDSDLSADETDGKSYSDCKVVLCDVRYTPAWEQYVSPRQETSSGKCELHIDKRPTNGLENPAIILEKCPPWVSRKRSLENGTNEIEEYSTEPILSTSKQSVPITLSNYRHIKRAKIEKQDNSTQDKSSRIVTAHNEKMIIENDSDVIEIISDSCDKNFMDGNDDIVEIEEIETTADESVPMVHFGNITNAKKLLFSKDNVISSVKNASEKCAKISHKQIEELQTTTDDSILISASNETITAVNCKNSESLSTSSSVPRSSDTKPELQKRQVDLKSSIDNVIEVDTEDLSVTMEDTKTKTSPKTNSKQKELLDNVEHIQGNFMCNGNPLHVQKELDEKSRSKTAKNSDNDDIVVIDEIIKPKTPTKVASDVIDIEEILDSPEQPPKPVRSKELGVYQPVNLTEIIRKCNFSSSNNKIQAGPSKQVTLTRNNFHAGKPANRGRSVVQHFRPMANINVSNTVRSSNNSFLNQRQPVNGRQFTSLRAQNGPNAQFFSNNANVTMKSTQAAVQRRQCTQRTVQMFDSKTNRIITRKEITVVQQSVMQVVGQNSRVVNRQMCNINKQKNIVRKNISSDDVITLD